MKIQTQFQNHTKFEGNFMRNSDSRGDTAENAENTENTENAEKKWTPLIFFFLLVFSF